MKTIPPETLDAQFSDGIAAWSNDACRITVDAIARRIAERHDARDIVVARADAARGRIEIFTPTGERLEVKAGPSRIELLMRGLDDPLLAHRRPLASDWSADAERFADEMVSYIQSSFTLFAARPPFIDMSLSAPLSDDVVKRVAEMFDVIPAEEYNARSTDRVVGDGSSSMPLSALKAADVVRMGDRELKKLPKFYRAPSGLMSPLRDSRGTSCSLRKMRNIALSLRYEGKLPHADCHRVIWGVDGTRVGDLVYEQTHTVCDFLWYCARGSDGAKYPVTLYAVPHFQGGLEEQFMAGMAGFLENFKWSPDWDAEFDMATLCRRFWETHSDENLFIGGFVWHRDGAWGVYYDCAGAGMGNLLELSPRQLYFLYTFVPPGAGSNTSGMLHFFTDPNNAKAHGSTWKPDFADVTWNFYPGQPNAEILQAIRNYSHSY